MTSFRFFSAFRAGSRALRSVAFAAVVLAGMGSALGLGRPATASTQIDGTQPLVPALAGYDNKWVQPYVNLWSGNLVVRQALSVGARSNMPHPVLDPGVDISFGSSPAVRSLAGPAGQIQALSRIPILRNLNVALTYNASDFGIPGRWRHSYEIANISSTTHDIIIWADGRRDLYTRTINGADTSWVGHASLEADTIRRVGATHVLSAQHGGAYEFDLAGRLTAIRDRTGAQVTCTYPADDTTVTFVQGPYSGLGFTYNGSGRLSTISDGLRPSPTTLGYDGSGRLSAVTDPTGAVVQYAYDGSNRLTSIIEQDGDALTIAYYPGLAVVREVTMGQSRRTFSFDGATRTTRVYDLLDPSTVSEIAYTFDASGRCTSVNDNSNTYSSVYDPTTSRRTHFTDAHGITVTARYDALGNLTSVADSYGNRDSLTLEPKFHLASKLQDPTGATQTIARDTTTGDPTQMSDALGNAVHLSWAGAGCPTCGTQLNRTIGARTDTTQYFYNGMGSVGTVLDPGGVAHHFGYDNLQRLIEVDDPRGIAPPTVITYTDRDELATVVQPSSHTTTYAWRPAGQQSSVALPSGATTINSYDALNRVMSSTDPLGNATQFTRDDGGRVIARTDPLGHAAQFTYDALGRVLTTTDADGSVWTGSWDCCRLTSTTDPTFQTVTFGYDARGLLASRSSADVSDSYSYDKAGRLLSASTSDGDTVVSHTYTYDSMGRLVRHRQTGIALDTHYDLDAGGLPIRLWDTGRPDSVRFAYDKRGLPTSVSAPVNGVGFTAALTWDPLAHLAGVAYNTGVTSAFAYDSLARPASIDHAGNGWSASYGFAYNPDGEVLDVNANHPGLGPVTIDLPRDANQRIIGEQYTPGRDFSYSYDAAGRRTLKTAPYSTDTYTYASDDRLLSAGTTSLQWDAAGRCTVMIMAPDSLHITYRSDGALETITGRATGGPIISTWRATIGPFGELAGWVLPDGQRLWFGYDRVESGLLRRSTSLVHFGTQFREDYLFAAGSEVPLMWEFRGGPSPDSTRRQAVLPGPFRSVTEVARGGTGASTGALHGRHLYGAFGEAPDPGAGFNPAPLQGFAGFDIVPRNNGAGSTVPGIPDSTLLVSQDGELYAPRLGIRLSRESKIADAICFRKMVRLTEPTPGIPPSEHGGSLIRKWTGYDQEKCLECMQNRQDCLGKCRGDIGCMDDCGSSYQECEKAYCRLDWGRRSWWR